MSYLYKFWFSSTITRTTSRPSLQVAALEEFVSTISEPEDASEMEITLSVVSSEGEVQWKDHKDNVKIQTYLLKIKKLLSTHK